MVGKLGCGCCGTSPSPVPGGCTVCDLLWSGYPADVLAYTDNFSAVDPGWRLLLNWIIPLYGAHPTTPVDTVPPNTITDYLRSNRLHFFRSPFITWYDRFVTLTTRAVPPAPLPNTANGRQPWLNAIRRANLYFPKNQPRKYRFEVTVNYPSDTLPRIASADHRPYHGMTGIFAVGAGSFYIYPSGLGIGTDNNSSAVLNVGLQLMNSQAFPYWLPSFEQTVTVPFGQVKLRFEYTYQPQTGIGVRSYYVNDVLQRQISANGFFFSPATSGTDCVSACGTIVQLAAYEPWRNATSPAQSYFPLWDWNGYNWLRAAGNASGPDNMIFSTTWLAANNPADKLWFDDYSMTIVSP
jgi:hypothetical protein